MKFYEKRMKICKACEHFKPVLGGQVDVCGDCGCLMQLKARIAIARCSQDKWGPEDNNDSNSS